MNYRSGYKLHFYSYFLCVLLLHIITNKSAYASAKTDSLKQHLNSDLADTTLLRLYFDIGLAEYYDYENDSSVLYFKKAINLAGNIGKFETEADAHYYLGELYAYIGDYDKALEHYFKGLDYYSANDNLTGLNNCYFGAGLVYKYKAYFNVARTYYQLSVEISQRLNDSLGLADVYNNLGTVEKNLGNYPIAMEYFAEVLEIAKSKNLNIHEVNALNNIGQLHDLQGSPVKALDYYKNSLELARKANNKFYLFVPMVNLASAYAETEEYNKALDLFNEALVLSNLTKNNSRIAYCYSELGSLMQQMDKFKEANKQFDKALIIAQKTRNLILEGEIFLSLSKLELARQKYGTAHDYAQKSLQLADSTNALPDKANAYEQLYKIATEQNRFHEGLVFHEKWIEIKDSLYSIEKTKAIEELDIQYQVRTKTEENERLKSEATIMQQVLKQGKRISFLLGTGALLAIVVLVLLVIQIKNRNKLQQKEKALNQQKVENLNNKIEYQNRELVTKSMFIAEKNTTVERIVKQLNELSKNGNNNPAKIKSLIRELNFDLKNKKHWKEFEAHFNDVHPGFYSRLNEKYPDLTVNDRKLAAFLKMKLSIKDVSGITGQSVKSIEVARTRLRKKLGMQHFDNLYNVVERI